MFVVSASLLSLMPALECSARGKRRDNVPSVVRVESVVDLSRGTNKMEITDISHVS